MTLHVFGCNPGSTLATIFEYFRPVSFKQSRRFIIWRMFDWSIDHSLISPFQVVPQPPLIFVKRIPPSKGSAILEVFRNESKLLLEATSSIATIIKIKQYQTVISFVLLWNTRLAYYTIVPVLQTSVDRNSIIRNIYIYIYEYGISLAALIVLLSVVVISHKKISIYLQLFDPKHNFKCFSFTTNHHSFSITNKRPEHISLLIIVLVVLFITTINLIMPIIFWNQTWPSNVVSCDHILSVKIHLSRR